MAKINIELCSDLCPASGAGFGSVIDTDVCYDALGIPYIPSRRLKGCLREAAEDIGSSAIKEIFGEAGASTGGSLRFSFDARISNYEDASKQLRGAAPEEVLDLFTYTRASTEIDGGTVKPESLHFTRVVKQYSPVGQQPLEFIAECDIAPEFVNEMDRICKALRNIGYKRNRGFGAVRCCFDQDEGKSEKYFPELQDEAQYALPITITNNVPLVLSRQNDDETETYISGTQVLGALAWVYPDKLSDDFADLFLRGNAMFSNCVLGMMPAPLCYAKMKRAGTYINQATENIPKDDAPKPLKGKYLDQGGEVIEAEEEVIYHHRTEKEDQDALLYVQTALCAGQTFNGTISGKGIFLKRLQPLLAGGTLRLGKSKTAQYAMCEIEVGDPLPPLKEVAPDQPIVVVLLSDVLLLKDCAYTTDRAVLLEAIGLGADICEERTSLAYRTVTGYSGVWNLKKPHARAFKAGSVLVFDSPTRTLMEEFSIGERQHEGFGRCMAIPLDKMPKIKAAKREEKKQEKMDSYTAFLLKSTLQKSIKAQAVAYAKAHDLPGTVTSSQIGRVLLMLEQSTSWNDFQARISSIKTSSVREALLVYIGEENSDYRVYWDTVLRWQKYQRKIDVAKGGKAE